MSIYDFKYYDCVAYACSLLNNQLTIQKKLYIFSRLLSLYIELTADCMACSSRFGNLSFAILLLLINV